MPDAPADSVTAIPPSNRRAAVERALVAGLAAFAVLRVLIFAGAFPFFANVDEHKHVDMVFKYARGYLPAPGAETFEPEVGTALGLYSSPEYLSEAVPGGTLRPPPPSWTLPPDAMVDRIRRNEDFLRFGNKEAHQPPVYYALAGGWLELGRALGLRGAYLLYWIRALGPLFAGALVVVSYLFIRRWAPDDPFVRLGVPALLAALPQDAFYYVTPDSLSPLLGGLAFLLAARIALESRPSAALVVAAGLATAAAFLTKYTNVALFPVLALACVWGAASNERRSAAGRLALAAASVALPAGLWLLRNQLVLGDLTGSDFKVEQLDWGRRAPGDWIDHPIFTPSGLAAFFGDLIPRFWRGELVWHQTTLRTPWMDGVYIASTAVFLAAACAALLPRARVGAARTVDRLALVWVAGGVGVLALLSLAFAFPEVGVPSASHPYMAHGRLIDGGLVPFCLLFVRGIERTAGMASGRFAPWLGPAVLAAILVAATLSEVAVSRPVFASAYNWYHLP